MLHKRRRIPNVSAVRALSAPIDPSGFRQQVRIELQKAAGSSLSQAGRNQLYRILASQSDQAQPSKAVPDVKPHLTLPSKSDLFERDASRSLPECDGSRILAGSVNLHQLH